MPQTEQRHIEALETLAGLRPRAREQRAVRIDDLTPLLRLRAKLHAQQAAGGTPTAAEFAALLEDVQFINDRLIQVATILQKHLLP